MGFFKKKPAPAAPAPQNSGLEKTREGLFSKLGRLFQYYKTMNDEFFEELEAVLVSADIGARASAEIIAGVREDVKRGKITNPEEIHALLRAQMQKLLLPRTEENEFPLLILVVGVNGVGKTTAIGKLACRFAAEGKKVLLAAGDTFRAAAAEQLEIWAGRAGADIITHHHQGGADSAAVIFDAMEAGLARKADVILCDTAGRLQNKKNLMDELAKIGRIITGKWQGARKNYLVLDATTGQNALSQAKLFNEAVALDGIILTKLDGTAKGGVVLAVNRELGLPVQYVGVGEGKEDLRPFDAEEFAKNII